MVMYGMRSLERGCWSPDGSAGLTMDLSQNYDNASKCTITDTQSQASFFQYKLGMASGRLEAALVPCSSFIACN